MMLRCVRPLLGQIIEYRCQIQSDCHLKAKRKLSERKCVWVVSDSLFPRVSYRQTTSLTRSLWIRYACHYYIRVTVNILMGLLQRYCKQDKCYVCYVFHLLQASFPSVLLKSILSLGNGGGSFLLFKISSRSVEYLHTFYYF